jgi:hypothetical protein
VKKTSLFAARSMFSVLMSLMFWSLLLPGGHARAQTPVYQRTIHRSVAEVQTFLQTLRPEAGGRLPTLEGFVQQDDQPLEHFGRGYFECTFEAVPAVGGGTMVQATAKITAWYTDPMPARSGYRVLVSNGRLENDFLDRIEEALIATGKSPSATAQKPSAIAPAAGAPSGPSANTDGLQPPDRPKPAAIGSRESSSLDSSLPGPAPATLRLAPTPAMSLPAGESLESARVRRQAYEKQAVELTAYVKNMEEIQRNQSRPADLVAVKSAKAPIFAKPVADSQILFAAVTQDEFQLLGVEGAWAHVQISGPARGWIRRAQLEMPAGYAPPTGNADADPPLRAAIFRVSKEETSSFNGAWEPLKGKTVRIDWVEPVNPSSPSSAKEKLAFAMSVFLHGYENLNAAHQSTEGIVIVFDSADGGQIASAMSSVKGLAEGTVSERAFWRQCSLDPPESFQGSAKQ